MPESLLIQYTQLLHQSDDKANQFYVDHAEDDQFRHHADTLRKMHKKMQQSNLVPANYRGGPPVKTAIGKGTIKYVQDGYANYAEVTVEIHANPISYAIPSIRTEPGVHLYEPWIKVAVATAENFLNWNKDSYAIKITQLIGSTVDTTLINVVDATALAIDDAMQQLGVAYHAVPSKVNESREAVPENV